MNDGRIFFRPYIYGVLMLYFAITYTVLGMGDAAIATLIPEDHYFEIVGAAALLATSILFLWGFRIAPGFLDQSRTSLLKRWIYLGLALLFFFGAGEEISWGQRIFGIETPPALAELNKQDEFNFHNLSALENSRFFTADRLFDMFWASFAVLTPALALILPSFRRFADKFIPIVSWGIGLLFIYNYLWAKLAKVLYETAYVYERITLTQAVQEIKESNYAIIFILVGLYAVWDLKRRQSGGGTPAPASSAE